MIERSSVALLCCCCLLARSDLPPDVTGLVGSAPAPDKPLLPLKFWDTARKSPLKPRRRDLHEGTLLRLMGPDFDSRWMKRMLHDTNTQQPPVNGAERQTVKELRSLLSEVELPADLPLEYRLMVKTWLVKTATCPINYVWDDLGVYFWPRWIKRGECVHVSAGLNIHGHRRNSSSSGGRVKYSREIPLAPSCSWPPGMMCVPGVARNLQILRWHCRLRKNMNNSNNVWRADRMRKVADQRKTRRKKYRCLWLKVPYPVPEECVCSC